MAPMMRLILGLVVLAVIMGAVAVGLPAHVTVTRSQDINAPEYIVFPYLNNLHEFAKWSPWAARDPNIKMTFSGPPEGKGARVDWVSEKPSIGTGSMQITESEPSRSIDLAVNFDGLEGTGSYILSPAGSGTRVSWSFGYEPGSSPLKRWKGLMLDGFIGSEYQVGLGRLKARIEEDRRPAAPVATPPQPEVPVTGAPESAAAPGQTVVPQTPGAAQGAQQPAPAAEAAPPAPPQQRPRR